MSTTLEIDNAVSYDLTIHQSDEIGEPTPLALESEWLLTNGMGGFAMGTVAGCCTRRYHGLLIAAYTPPVDRVNTVSKILDTLVCDGHEYPLYTLEFDSDEYHHHTVFHPQGFRYLKSFSKTPGSVTWVYEAGGVEITKTLRLLWRKQASVLSYRLRAIDSRAGGRHALPQHVELKLTPLLAMRDFHHHRQAQAGDRFAMEIHSQVDQPWVTLRSEVPLALHLASESGRFVEKRDWWYRFHHRCDAERGQDGSEDLYVPGSFVYTLSDLAANESNVRLWIGADPPSSYWGEVQGDGRREHLEAQYNYIEQHLELDTRLPEQERLATPKKLQRLIAAADDFVVSRMVGGVECRSILAGYPWFADWGRDTMISLPGLLLCTGGIQEAGQTLVAYARHIRNGLVPNRFDDYGGEPHYNTADASLWFVHAALEYQKLGGNDRVWNDDLAGACFQIIEAYQRGTDGPIGMDQDGLIYAGSLDTQLTWMDAKRDGVVFTPRSGKCVELNALWHRALVGCSQVLQTHTATAYRKLAERVKQSFLATFWSAEAGYLLDHVNENGADRSLRPNQMLAVSLPGDLLPADQQLRVMTMVRDHLLTPMGLRTLPKDDPNYHGRYAGSMFDRDRAYHQGTVWAWPIGHYIEGWLRANRYSDQSRCEAREALRPLLRELKRHSIGQLHEVFDGDAPHDPGGCMAQAWSVAEVLRAVLLVDGKPN